MKQWDVMLFRPDGDQAGAGISAPAEDLLMFLVASP
jgi:hypothetical protein